MLDTPLYDYGKNPHESVTLENLKIRDEFHCSLSEELGKLQFSLSCDYDINQHKAAAQRLSRQDWFDNNSDTIHSLLNNMHKAHQVTLTPASYSAIR